MSLRRQKGFTIIEVSLFLALSSFLMIGLIVGTNMSVSRQRYNDSINNFADYLRGAYSDVLNVSNYSTDSSDNFNGGRSTTAVYGKFIVFGEAETAGSTNSGTTVYSYDVVGNAISSSIASGLTGNTILDMLQSNTIKAAIIDNTDCQSASACNNSFYRMESYNIPWEGRAESSSGALARAAVLIVRSPITGTIRTYTFSTDSGSELPSFHLSLGVASARDNFRTFLSRMSQNDLDLCIDSDDNQNTNRRDVRVIGRASNSTGVFLVEMDGNDSKCTGRG
ncbi:prepilin-type N-terminal cleavage/methylation domain-containing protein [Candidatus Saccharibacteria bacterium]|nr:prepilin-type N-terminal cleavage/methylation domain-containing protein [Candidatus Saccharibacteria bacterium]